MELQACDMTRRFCLPSLLSLGRQALDGLWTSYDELVARVRAFGILGPRLPLPDAC